VVEGTRAYVATNHAGLITLDISNPNTPTLIGLDQIQGLSYTHLGYASEVQVVDGIAYVAARQSGLQIFNLSTPTTPPNHGTFDTENI
jgi:hypothetical protein